MPEEGLRVGDSKDRLSLIQSWGLLVTRVTKSARKYLKKQKPGLGLRWQVQGYPVMEPGGDDSQWLGSLVLQYSPLSLFGAPQGIKKKGYSSFPRLDEQTANTCCVKPTQFLCFLKSGNTRCERDPLGRNVSDTPLGHLRSW